MRDVTLGDTFQFGFSTRAFATGIPTTLAGTPALSVKEGANDTIITAGVSLDVDTGSTPVTGLHEGAVIATAANGYENGKSYYVYVSTGTVGGVSVVGEVVHEFTVGLGAASLKSIAARTRNANVYDTIREVSTLVEHQRGAHTHQHQATGGMFYVDPVNGDTHANGNRGGITDPYLTIQDCHDNAVTDSNHDVIILLSGAAAGPTTHTIAGTTTISKRYTFIRGPGRDFIVTRSGAGDTLAITADGVELSGFQLETAATGAGHGVQVTDADFLKVHNVWVNATQGDGINLLRAENCQIHENFFTDTGASGSGEGIHIVGTAGSSNKNSIFRNHFRDCQGDAIKIESGTTNDTNIYNNGIEGSSGWGINIGASSTDAFVHDNAFGNNTSGSITDAGTTSVITNNEQWAKDSIATEARLAELDAANIPSDLDDALADTNELQTDWTNGGRLDLILDIIAADTTTDIPALIATAQADLDIITGADGANLLSGTQASIDAIEVDTGTTLDGRIPAALVGGKMDSDATAISGDTTAADRLEAMMDGILIGQVNDAAATTTAFAADNFTEATDDHFNGRLITFISGALTGQQTDITDYDAAGGTQGSQELTVTALTEAPANNDFFVIH